VQPAPPKQFTDEELKQEYGIHLATRLQADGEDKQNKWADIDDEEDDWAPDTIEWNDGTKITIAPMETAAAPVVSATKESKAEAIKPSMPTTKVPSSVGPNATVLKVGSTTTVPLKLGGLVSKGFSEKPTLVAKPAVAAAVKSPWAPLPPVEKVSPVLINVAQQSSTRFGQKDPHGFEAMPPPPSPTKEIAADDFNRSWRDPQAGNMRELFNSQSGRYEPVNKARRGSIRVEPTFRAPSLLQRPLQADQPGPAEPSAAFQTNRSTASQDAGSWNRRRTSSNVSGGSGGFGRRMSSGKGPERPPAPSESHQQHRGSQPSLASDQIAPPTRNNTASALDENQKQYAGRVFSPVENNQHQPWQARHSPGVSHAQIKGQPLGSETLSVQVASTPAEQVSVQSSISEVQDPVVMQKKLMRERRELAVKRRQEQEAKEEADRKERIRAKMEALGLPPLEEEKASKAQSTKSQTLETRQDMPKAKLAVLDREPTVNGMVTTAQSPPKPPVPDISGEPKQYGMMRVHHPQTVKKLPSVSEPVVDQAWGEVVPADQICEPVVDQSWGAVMPADPTRETVVGQSWAEDMPADRTSSSFSDATVEAKNEMHLPIRNGTESTTQQSTFKLHNDLKPHKHLPEEQKEKPWQNVPQGSDTYTSWGEAGLVTHSAAGGNLWGTPGRDKALGNGTFDHNLTRLPQRQVTHQSRVSPPGPGPMGPSSVRSTVVPPHTGAIPLERPLRDGQSMPISAQEASESAREARHHQDNLSQDLRLPKPIAPPAPLRNQSRQAPNAVNKARVQSGWNNFHITAARDETEARDKARKAREARIAEEARTGVKQGLEADFSETFVQVAVDEGNGKRKYVNTAKEASTEQDFTDGQEGSQPGCSPVISKGIEAKATTKPHVATPAFGDYTFRQTALDDRTGGRNFVDTYKPVNVGQEGTRHTARNHLDNVMVAPKATSATSSGAGATGRGSRFFPQVLDESSSSDKRSASYSSVDSRCTSPPPPDSDDHPAYAGNVSKPTVSLPFMKPKPTVRLPPPVLVPVAPPELSKMQPPVQPLRVVSQPLVNTPSWQDRFNGLFGRKASPEKKHVLAVNSATKVPLEVPLTQVPAAVSLPRGDDGDVTTRFLDAGSITSTKMENEEALFEEREFGSLPTVRLPRHAPPAAWQPATPPSPLKPHSKLFHSPIVQETESHSIQPMFWSLWDQENLRTKAFVINVKLPGAMFNRALLMEWGYYSHPKYRPYPPERRMPANFKGRKGVKSKENPISTGHAKGVQAQPQSLPKNGTRPVFHGASWARRVSGVVQ